GGASVAWVLLVAAGIVAGCSGEPIGAGDVDGGGGCAVACVDAAPAPPDLAVCTHDCPCSGDEGCAAGERCDAATSRCVACLEDTDCARGLICERSSHTCRMGCTSAHPCASDGD